MLAPGEVLSNTYEIGELIGWGGMGQVYAAVDRRLGREVAIKVCRPGIDPACLHSEAAALATFDHPGIVRVYALCMDRGIDYLVMERLRGVSLYDFLSQRTAQHGLSIGETINIGIRVAEILSVLHRARFVHRDIKPDNIILTEDQRVVLLDFSVAIRRELAVADRRLVGSPPYMAPEALAICVADGQAHLLDIYALGIILFELVTGGRPYNQEDKGELLRAKWARPVPHLHHYTADVPRRLDRLVRLMMDPEPQHRPQPSEAVSTWLQAIRRRLHSVECTTLVKPPRGRGALAGDCPRRPSKPLNLAS